MKVLAAAVFFLSCAVFPVRAQVVVVMREARPSSQNPWITVLRDGKLEQGANVSVFDIDGEKKLSLTTGPQGMAQLPYLPAGRYCVAASTSPTLRGDLCLQIGKSHSSAPSAFSVELVVQPPPPPTLEEKLEAAEKAPIELLTRTFSGTVSDPTGAVIPRATLAVYRHGAGDTTHPLKSITDQQGRFSATLLPGRYTAVIQSPGFETRFLTFEISPHAAQEDLNVKLSVGAVA